jgi:predicted Zn-dependent peptidase
MDVEQGNLVIGFRWRRNGPADYPALAVFNELYGGGDTSRLFLNIREERALCYAVGSSVDRYKEVMFVTAGIDFQRREETEEAILAELAELAGGNISSDELETARKNVASAYLQGLDSPSSVCDFRLGQNLLGSGGDLRQYAALADEVKAEDIARIASEMKPELSYFLRRGAEE